MAASPGEIAARAQRAMREGRFGDALADLDHLAQAAPQDATVRLMRGYAYRAIGDLAKADTGFSEAVALKPDDAGLRIAYGKFLAENAGRPADAVMAFDEALRLAPGALEARIDRALAMARTRQRPEGLAELRAIVADHLEDIRAALSLAQWLREELEHAEALALIDGVLDRDPAHSAALALKAHCRFELGEPAADLFREARQAGGGGGELATHEAAALVAEDRADEGLALLDDMLADSPLWRRGQQVRAELRWQLGAGEDFGSGYELALEENPGAEGLWADYVGLVARAFGDARGLELVGRAHRQLPDSKALWFAEANLRRELHEFGRAEELYRKTDIDALPQLSIEFLRFLVMAHRFDEAVERGLSLVRQGFGGNAWPYLGIAWRMLGDARADWLERGGAFVAEIDLGLSGADTDALADRLRTLHRFAERPIQQTLRGGSQTDSHLFADADPAIRLLRARIEEAVRDYLGRLPEQDDTHPLLAGRRDYFRFEGSWSVLLRREGFHVPHVHSRGTISSAFYVSLPASLGKGGEDRQGWLQIGAPPEELGCDLASYRMIAPAPGRLALFPSYSWHGTLPFSEGERMTCAFDVRLS